MNCKYCGTPMDEGVEVCPNCGMENAEMPELAVQLDTAEETVQETEQEIASEESGKKKKSAWKIMLAIVGGVVLLGVLVCAVLYKMGVIDFKPKGNNVLYKETYTVSDKAALNKAKVVVATAGSEKLTNGVLQIYYNMEILNFLSNYSSYLSYFNLDYTKPLDQQYVAEGEPTTWQHMFVDNALNTWYTYAVLNMMAEDEGYVIGQDLQESIDTFPQQLLKLAQSNGYDTAEEMIAEDFGSASTLEGYLGYQIGHLTAMDYLNSKYESFIPTDAEVEAYFSENEQTLAESGITKDAGKYVDVRHILIQPEGGTTDEEGYTVYTEEAWEACKTTAQGILDQWLAGEATEESFAALAMEHSVDGSSSNGGLYTQVAHGDMVAEFDSWCFGEDRQYGEYGLVRTRFGYHIMYFVGSQEIWVAEVQNAMASERVDQLFLEAEERWPLKTKYKKIVLGEIDLT